MFEIEDDDKRLGELQRRIAELQSHVMSHNIFQVHTLYFYTYNYIYLKHLII